MSQVILVELKPKLCSACMCFWWPPCCMYQTWLGTLQLWHYLPQKKNRMFFLVTLMYGYSQRQKQTKNTYLFYESNFFSILMTT
jgi:hypothetical protein